MGSNTNLKRLDELWNLTRGVSENSVYIEHILGLVCYKYLSLPLEENSIMCKSENTAYHDSFKTKFTEKYGYFINSDYLFSTFSKHEPNRDFLMFLDNTFYKFNQEANSYKYKGLFDLNFIKLGQTPEDMFKIVSIIENICTSGDADVFSDTFDYLLTLLSERDGKGSSGLHTPKTVCELLARIMEYSYQDGHEIYDPAYKSGALLLSVAKNIDGAKIYGQDESKLNQNVAKMWTITNNIKNFDLKLGNSLENGVFSQKQFDIVVSNPPYSTKWSGVNRGQFENFSVLAPESKADYAYIQIMLSRLKDTGTMAVFLPLGILFRGGKEQRIREDLIRFKNYIDTVIQLPANLFIGTAIPVSLVILKKNRTEETILFINASNEYQKEKHKNTLSRENIEKISSAYDSREDIDKFSRLVSLKEIAANDYNLGVNRYIDTFEKEEVIDIEKLNLEISKTEKEIVNLERLILEYHEKIDNLIS